MGLGLFYAIGIEDKMIGNISLLRAYQEDKLSNFTSVDSVINSITPFVDPDFMEYQIKSGSLSSSLHIRASDVPEINKIFGVDGSELLIGKKVTAYYSKNDLNDLIGFTRLDE